MTISNTNLKYTSANIIHLYPYKFHMNVNLLKKLCINIYVPCKVIAREDREYMIEVMWYGKKMKWWVQHEELFRYGS